MKLFEAYWKNNLDLSNDIEVSQLLKTLDIDNKKIRENFCAAPL